MGIVETGSPIFYFCVLGNSFLLPFKFVLPELNLKFFSQSDNRLVSAVNSSLRIFGLFYLLPLLFLNSSAEDFGNGGRLPG